MGFNSLEFSNPSFGDPAVVLRTGLVQYNTAGLTGRELRSWHPSATGSDELAARYADPDAGRPSRLLSWNIACNARSLATWLWKQPMSATAAHGSVPTD